MIEIILIDYLENAVGVSTYAEEPEDKTGEYLVIDKLSGTNTDHMPTASVAIQSYADSLLGAAQLNERMKAAMDEILDNDKIFYCRLNSDYNYTDTTTKHYRYQAVYDLVYFD